LMSAATSVAFIACAAVLIGGTAWRSPRRALVHDLLTAVVAAIGVLGLGGYVVSAPLLFPVYPFSGMALHTALGFIVLAAGLRRAAGPRAPRIAASRPDDRITAVGAAVLAAISLAAGIAAFAILERRLQEIVQDNLLAAMARRVDVFVDMIELREGSAKIAATRPAAARNLRVLRAGRDDGSNLANLRAVVDSFVQQGFSAIAYRDADGKVAAQGGRFVESPALAVELATPAKGALLWSDGFILRHRIDVYDAGERVGDVTTEQPLTVLTRLARTPAGNGATWDMGVCVRRDEGLHCFPQLLSAEVFTTPLLNAAGEPLPMTLAVAGEVGTVVTRDYRGQFVLAAYGPVGALGPGMVVKVDTAEVFGPIREQLVIALVALALLLAGGTWLLRRQVKPLATLLVESERRLKDVNRELDRRVLELQAANHELEAFSYSVSHDLRAPLRHIDGFAEMLKDEAWERLDEPTRRYVDMIREAASRMGRLIDELLAFSRMGRVELAFQPVDMNALVAESIDEVTRGSAHPPIEWGVAPLPVAQADRATLRQVWVNLLSNAVKYAGRRPLIRIDIGCEHAGSEWHFSVRDNGAGFDMRHAAKLFGVFQRLHHEDEFEGTGIGLAIVRRIVGRHGGRTWAEGKPGEGAVFHFTLPDPAKEIP
jgi:signal transduction histidine kinase